MLTIGMIFALKNLMLNDFAMKTDPIMEVLHMMKTIIFDNGSFKWEDDYETNWCTIKSTTRLLYRSFDVRGYMYLNDIYEHFGIAWDPHEHNECFIKGSNSFILSWEHLKDNAFEINIYSV